MNTPPGQVGPTWLRHRIELAERAAELLEFTLRRLLDEQHRVEEELADLETRWRTAVTAARVLLLRAQLTGGQRGLRLGAAADPGRVAITWTGLVGVRYPADARYTPPPGGRADGVVDTVPAVTAARERHRHALDTGVRYAAALSAHAALSREIGSTHRRLRALHQRSLPRLRTSLHDLELTIEEHEHAEDTLRRARRPQVRN